MGKRVREQRKKRSAVGMIEAEQQIKGKVSVERPDFLMSAGSRRWSNSRMQPELTGA